MIRQGDLYWVHMDEPSASEPGYSHPCAVVQNDVFNQSQVRTVVVCALTSNLRRARYPGNVLLDLGEAGLPRQSVVNITQILTVDRSQLGECIGTLSPERVREVMAGLRLLLEPRST